MPDKHIFISYSRHDEEYALFLKDELERNGYAVWIDQVSLRGGRRWPRTIKKAIEDCYAFVLVATPNSEESDWVEKEYLYAQELDKLIIPLLHKGKVWFTFININYIDARTSHIIPTELFTTLHNLPSHPVPPPKTITTENAHLVKVLRTFGGHSHWVRSVAFSPDGRTALSGSDDDTMKLWDLEGARTSLRPRAGVWPDFV